MKSAAAAERFGAGTAEVDVLGLEVESAGGRVSRLGRELQRLVEIDEERDKLRAAARKRTDEYERMRVIGCEESSQDLALEKERSRIVDAIGVRLRRRVIPAEREELRGSRASHLEGVVELLGGSPKREGGA